MEKNKLKELQNKVEQWSKYTQPTKIEVDNLVTQIDKLLPDANNQRLLLGEDLQNIKHDPLTEKITKLTNLITIRLKHKINFT